MTIQLLSLSGGGYLGYYTALVLAGIEERAGTPLARHFDLLSGTSIGGMTALALAAEIPMRKVATAFEEKGSFIFSDQPKPRGVKEGLGVLARSALRPRYKAERLRRAFNDILEDCRLGDLTHPVLIPVVDAADGSARLFCSRSAADAALSATEIAVATAAVPTFYPMAEVAGKRYVDGGLYANAPDMIALIEAQRRLSADFADMAVLSIGTTTSCYTMPPGTRPDMGAAEWLMHERMVRITMAAQQSSTEQLARTLLGERYLRIDADQTAEDQTVLGLDIATEDAQVILRRLAAESLEKVADSTTLANMLKHTPGGTLKVG